MQTCKNVNSICQETFLGFVQWKKIALLYFKPKNKKVYFWQLAGAFLKERSACYKLCHGMSTPERSPPTSALDLQIKPR